MSTVISDIPDFRIISTKQASDKLPEAIRELLSDSNGFFAYANSLHIFYSDANKQENSLEWWNANSTWQHSYDIDFTNHLFFAEDVFGWQFSYSENGIYLFDPVQATFSRQAATVDDWIDQVLLDPTKAVGYSFALEWQDENGALADSDRISVLPPFAFATQNNNRSYKAMSRIELMNYNADLYMQIKDLPDGSDIKLTMK